MGQMAENFANWIPGGWIQGLVKKGLGVDRAAQTIMQNGQDKTIEAAGRALIGKANGGISYVASMSQTALLGFHSTTRMIDDAAIGVDDILKCDNPHPLFVTSHSFAHLQNFLRIVTMYVRDSHVIFHMKEAQYHSY